MPERASEVRILPLPQTIDTPTEVAQAVNLGADWVLVVGRIPDVHGEKCMIDPLALAEIKTIPPHMRCVWNARDLKTGGMKTETLAEARVFFNGWLCHASFIRTIVDIEHGADAALVGTNLIDFGKSIAC